MHYKYFPIVLFGVKCYVFSVFLKYSFSPGAVLPSDPWLLPVPCSCSAGGGAVAVADDILIASLALLATSWAGVTFATNGGANTAISICFSLNRR